MKSAFVGFFCYGCVTTVARAPDGDFDLVVALITLYIESEYVCRKSRKWWTVYEDPMSLRALGTGCVYTGYEQRRSSWYISDISNFSHI